MKGALVDSNAILEVIIDDSMGAYLSEFRLEEYCCYAILYTNLIIYSEISTLSDSEKYRYRKN